MRRRTAGILLLTLLAVGSGPAWAVILRLVPLSEVLKETPFIFLAKVEKVDPDRPAAVLTVSEDLKGKFPFRRLPVNLTGDKEAKKDDHTGKLLKRLAPEVPLVLFASQRGKQYTLFGFTNGTWFQMIGQQADGSHKIVWAFTHAEPYLRRTFKGTTAEMRQIVIDVLAGKRKPPEPDPKEPPGFGPEAAPASPRSMHGAPRFTASAPWAVIPSLGVGGPLAILALLFPGLFGGVLVLFRRWLAFFTVVSVVSTVYFVHWLWGGDLLRNSWWNSGQALWLVLTLVTLAGTLWAWRRHLPRDGAVPAPVSPRTEHIVLWILSLTCLAIAIIVLFDPPGAYDTSWNLFLAFAVGIWAGTLVRLVQALTRARGGLPTEGVMLWTALVVFVAYAAVRPGGSWTRPIEVADEGKTDAHGRPLARLIPKSDSFELLPDNGPGLTFSTPHIAGDRAYLAAAHFAGLNTFGVLYCFDMKTRKIVWMFDDDRTMKPVFSSPVVVDGKVYVGEGLHTDSGCHIFCIDADTGKKIWSFATGSHTEATPLVQDGRVYVGAGDDGVYCLDAKTGRKIWQFPDPKGEKELHLHVDSTPAVAGNRVYIGGGIDEDIDQGDAAICCVDADTGKKIWLERTPKWMVLRGDPKAQTFHVPCWGSPVVDGGLVFFGLGNGKMSIPSVKYEPVGGLWCVDRGTGKEVWSYRSGPVLSRAAVDDERVYFGSHDGNVYCLDRHSGRERWKRQLMNPDVGYPTIASPVLAHCTSCGHTTSVFVLSQERIDCFDPATGKKHWQYPLSNSPALFRAPAVRVASGPEGERRQLFFAGNFFTNTVNGMPQSGTIAICVLEDLLPKR